MNNSELTGNDNQGVVETDIVIFPVEEELSDEGIPIDTNTLERKQQQQEQINK